MSLLSQVQTKLTRYTLADGTLTQAQWAQAVQAGLSAYNRQLAPAAHAYVNLTASTVEYDLSADWALDPARVGQIISLAEPLVTDTHWTGWEAINEWQRHGNIISILPERTSDHTAVLRYMRNYIPTDVFPALHEECILSSVAAEALTMLAEAAALDAISESEGGVVTRDKRGRYESLMKAVDYNRTLFERQIGSLVFAQVYQ